MTSLRLFLRSSYPIERMLALTDGVYAIVLTLLVLDLKVPEVSGPTNTDLRTDLIAQIPNFIAYLVSFVLVAFFWMNHERLFAVTKRCDERMMVVNAVHLLMVSLVPYTASLIGHYEGDRIAAMMFCANMGLASLTMVLLHRALYAHPEWLSDQLEGNWITMPWSVAYLGPILGVMTMLVVLVSIEGALALWFLLPLRNTWYRRSAQNRATT